MNTSEKSRALLKVKTVQEKETDKGREYTVVLEGCNDYVDVKVTLKSGLKGEIENLVPMNVGESRYMDLRMVNKTLDEFAGGLHLDADDIEAVKKSRYERKIMAEGEELMKEMDVALEKRKAAAAEQG